MKLAGNLVSGFPAATWRPASLQLTENRACLLSLLFGYFPLGYMGIRYRDLDTRTVERRLAATAEILRGRLAADPE